MQEPTTRRQRRTRVTGLALIGLGAAAAASAFVSSPAAAWEGSCFDFASPDRPWTELRVDMGDTNPVEIAGAGQSFSDGTLTVTISGAQALAGTGPLTTGNVGSVAFSASPGVDAAYVRAGGYDDQMYLYHPPSPATSGTGLRSTSGTTAIDWLALCYSPTTPVQETTTTTTTTTAAPTTAAPTTTAAAVLPEVVTAPPTTPAPQVLAEVQTAPELAFTGSSSRGVVFVGSLLVSAGLALLAGERIVARRSAR
jgi:hypothetical protein